MNCAGCNKHLEEQDTIIEAAVQYVYCMDCVRVFTLATKRVLDAA